jgi:phosphoribosylglycinamide formyltransferase-1
MKKLAVLASGGGSNLQSLIDQVHLKDGIIAVVISDRKGAYALQRAADNGIDAVHIGRKSYESDMAFNRAILKTLNTYEVDGIVLAGYLKILSEEIVDAYSNKIINVHPALIPSFCGDGFHGMHVHEAAYKKGVKVSGPTVHFVDAGVDTGPIILQRAVALDACDGPEAIQKKVLKEEHILLPEAVRLFLQDRLSVRDGRVYIE